MRDVTLVIVILCRTECDCRVLAIRDCVQMNCEIFYCDVSRFQ